MLLQRGWVDKNRLDRQVNMIKITKLLAIVSMLVAISCDRDDGWFGGVPIEVNLIGTWTLEKLVTPTRSLSGAQIGYEEILKSGHETDDDVERVYRNDMLVAKHIWTRVPGTVAKTKTMTVLVTYRGSGLKRLYKIKKQTGQPTVLEASAYLPELGGAADTVKYFYREVW